VKIKIGKLVITWADPCELHQCTYYTHYLRWGGPDMSHEAFHIAEQECLYWQARAEADWREGQDEPDWILQRCRKLEKEIRA
jgi:hypothetical protein